MHPMKRSGDQEYSTGEKSEPNLTSRRVWKRYVPCVSGTSR